MKRQSAVALIGLVVAACSSPPPARDSLAWLGGCWQSEDGTSREIWSDGYDGLRFGYSVTMDGRAVSFWETLRIEPMGDAFLYTASPVGRAGVEFLEVERDTTSIVFENAEHDYPQRIAYLRAGDQLTATISAIAEDRGTTFSYRLCRR